MTAADLKSKKIALLINAFEVGGAERVFIDQANELFRRGYDVQVFTLFRSGAWIDELELPAERIHSFGATSLFDRRALMQAVRVIRQAHVDILYTTLNEANTAGRIIKLFIPRLSLVTREMNMADVKTPLYKTVDIVLGFTSASIITVSNAVGKSITAYAPWLSKKMTTLYNGIEIPQEMPTHSFDSHRLLSIGSLTEKKNHTVLITALARLPSEFTLTIAGDGVLRAKLEAQAKDMGLAERVTFLGRVTPAVRDNLCLTHDAFVLPSLREGCPNVVSEAQRAALPVVAFSIPGMDEFVDGTCGVLVSERTPKALSEGIESIFVSSTRLRELSERGFNVVKNSREHTQQFEKLVSLFARV